MTSVGCLLHLIAFVVVALLVDRGTVTSLPPALSPWFALVAGALLTLGSSNVWTLARGYGQGDASRRMLLQRAKAGQPPPQDGPILATGTVRPEGPTLVSPVTGHPCVAYTYRIYHRYLVTNGGWETRVHYWGYAGRPFRLDTPSQALRVLAMPRLVDPPTRFEDVPDARARTEAYLRATRFETGMPAEDVLNAVRTLTDELFTERRLEVRRDWRREGAPTDLAGLRIEEQVLPVDTTASAWGLWSSDRRGIVPGSLTSGTPGVAMSVGSPDGLIGRAGGLPSSVWAVAAAGLVLLALGATLVWAARAGYVAQVWAAWGQVS
jgi:hypothetical protein